MSKADRQRAPLASSDVGLATLERLLAIPATGLSASLEQAADVLATTFAAEKVDVFLYEHATESLVAEGTSDTPLGREQRRLGLDHLQLAHGGAAVRVFQTGEPHLTLRADEEGELPGLVDALGIRSEILAPVDFGGARRGVLLASSRTPEYFGVDHLELLQSVSRWVGLVAERAELTQRLASEAAARDRYRTAEELLAVVAHDLRNQIAPLRGRLDLLKRRAQRGGHEDLARDATSAVGTVDRLGKLVNDVLDAERLQHGLFTLRLEAVELVSLARAVAEPLAVEEVRIAVEAPEELWLPADPERVAQCIQNVVANAVKHSPTDGHIWLRISRERRNDLYGARLSIRDEGPGIAPELVPRLFERFARRGASAGLGLGLFLASGIAEAHGGTLTLDSPPGASAEFTLWLPIAADA